MSVRDGFFELLRLTRDPDGPWPVPGELVPDAAGLVEAGLAATDGGVVWLTAAGLHSRVFRDVRERERKDSEGDELAAHLVGVLKKLAEPIHNYPASGV